MRVNIGCLRTTATIAWAFAFTVLDTVAAPAQKATAGAVSSSSTSILLAGDPEVPMRLVDGRPVVEGWINGHGPFLFGIETGGPYDVVLDERVGVTLGLTGTRDPTQRSVVDSLRIGGFLARRVPLSMRAGIGVPGIDGMLGLAFYRGLSISIDFRRGTVRFTSDTLPAEDGRSIAPLVTRGPLLGLDAHVGSLLVPLTIDTQGGAVGLVCSQEMVQGLPLAAKPVVIGQALVGGVGAPPVITRGARLDGDLVIAGMRYQKPFVSTLPLPPDIGCLFGLDLLRTTSVVLDQRSGRVRIVGDSVVPPPPPYYAFGISISSGEGGTFRVTRVSAGGAAERGGVQAGDEVLEIEGRPATRAGTAPSAIRSLAAERRTVRLLLQRDGVRRLVELSPALLIP